MGVMIRRVFVLLTLVLLTVVCGAKKLWGVDVGKKEDVRVWNTRHATCLYNMVVVTDVVYR